jgi:putative nucleotidyltransferase with HDIG domain
VEAENRQVGLSKHRKGTGIGEVGRTFLVLAILAASLLWTVSSYRPTWSDQSNLWLVLPCLALLAELLPVELSGRGVRIAFTLPFVAGMVFAQGPMPAIATDALVTLFAGYAMVRRRRAPAAHLWLWINVFVGVISASIGSLWYIAAEGTFGHGEPVAALLCVAFMLGYGLTNFLLVTHLDSRSSHKPWGENLASTFKLSAKSFALYTLVGIAVAVLVREGFSHYAAFTLVPVLALRTALQYQSKMHDHYYETITALTLMLQRAHPYTHGHLERVALAAEEVARRLGLSGSRAQMVREAAVLHDIGKIAVDEALLDKPAKLTEVEMSHVRMHAEWGAEILSSVRSFKDIRTWIRHHHERPDGKGYPCGLRDGDIPIESKIIAVVDAYDAMTGSSQLGAQRSYRDPMTVDEALEELARCSGTQFDERVVGAFRGVVLEGRF